MIRLPNDEVHLWRVPTGNDKEEIAGMRDLLSQDETVRADRFVHPRDRNLYVSCHAALRLAISRYLGGHPKRVVLEYGPWGKPMIAGEDGLRFSISHSHVSGVLAFAKDREVGIDLERVRSLPSLREMAERTFSRREAEDLRNLPGESGTIGFFRCWTRKEAFIKGTGKGLSLQLDRFSVSVAPEGPAALLDVSWDPEEANRWRILDLPESDFRSGERYIGAVAAMGTDWNLIDRKEIDLWGRHPA